jgi:hypothetical protein
VHWPCILLGDGGEQDFWTLHGSLAACPAYATSQTACCAEALHLRGWQWRCADSLPNGNTWERHGKPKPKQGDVISDAGRYGQRRGASYRAASRWWAADIGRADCRLDNRVMGSAPSSPETSSAVVSLSQGRSGRACLVLPRNYLVCPAGLTLADRWC